MDQELYYGLLRTLATGEIPSTLTETKKTEVEKNINLYTYQGTQLFRKGDRQGTHGGRQHRDPREVIPKHRKTKLLKQIHDHPLGGHQGQENTYQRTSELYFWPGMRRDIVNYVRTCDVCQKRERKRGEAPLEPIKKPSTPFYHIGIDVMGPLPRSWTGKRYVIVAIDHFTKWVEAQSLETADAQSVLAFVYEEVICRHGVPQRITSDRGSEFVNELIKALTRVYKIHHIKTTAYHPQGNGQTERVNSTLKDILSKITPPKKGNWDHYLQSAVYATRVSVHESTKFSPAELLHGYKFRQPYDHRDQEVQEISPESYAHQEFARIQEIRAQASKFIEKAQDRQKAYHDQSKHLVEPLEIGDRVKLYRNIVEASFSAKLEPKWEGPYIIADKKNLTYRLKNPDGSPIPNTFHRNRLKLYHDRPDEQHRPYVEIQVRNRSVEIASRARHESNEVSTGREGDFPRNQEGTNHGGSLRRRNPNPHGPTIQYGPVGILRIRRETLLPRTSCPMGESNADDGRVPLQLLQGRTQRDPSFRRRVADELPKSQRPRQDHPARRAPSPGFQRTSRSGTKQL